MNEKPISADLVPANSIADWAAAQLALPVGPSQSKRYDDRSFPASAEVMDALFDARTRPGVIVIGGPRYGKTMALRFKTAKIVGPNEVPPELEAGP